jgi:alpha-glucoside transport system permease protein
MGQAFFNSIAITVPATVLPVLLAALAAFAFAWIPFPGRDALFLGVIALLVIPIQMTFVPVLQLLNPLGLTKSYAGIWLAHTAFGLPFAIFLLRNFFILLPSDLIESARIDGANNLSIFFRIIVPLSVPAIASLTIFQFLGVWNDLLMALVFIQNPNARPLTVAISGLQSTYGVEWDLLSAGAFVLMVVPLIVFFSLQRYFVQGLLAGSVK